MAPVPFEAVLVPGFVITYHQSSNQKSSFSTGSIWYVSRTSNPSHARGPAHAGARRTGMATDAGCNVHLQGSWTKLSNFSAVLFSKQQR
jgi:hypothetical protein